MQFADRSGVHLDMARQARIGIAEIVYGRHKSAIQLREIARRHREAGADMLITRFGPV